MWEITYGLIPDGLCVLHRCDVKSCVNPAHLWLGTALDNAEDRDRKGRRSPPRGEMNGRVKLTAVKVEEIRALNAIGFSQAELSKRFGVSDFAVFSIVHRRSWT